VRPRRRTRGVDKSVKTADWGLPGEQGTRPKGDGADRIASVLLQENGLPLYHLWDLAKLCVLDFIKSAIYPKIMTDTVFIKEM